MASEQFAPDAVRRLDPLEIPNWDALLTNRPDFSFFHSSAWAKVLADTYGFTPHYFFTGSAAAPVAVLPLMEVNSWLTGRRGIALPFTDECAPLGVDKTSFKKLFAAAVDFGKERGWKHIELRGGRNCFDREVPASVSFYGHSLNLSAGEELLFQNMDGSVRRAVRKAEKDGVTVEVSQGSDAVQIFYRLQCLTRKRHGLPPQPFAFFLNIHRHILSENRGVVVVARHARKPVAASVYFYLGDRAIYKYGASDFAFQHLRGSNLVMWEAIKWLGRNGAKSLDLGKTALANEGLRRFKLDLGALEKRVEYVLFDLRRNDFATAADNVEGWHNAVFRALPVGLSRVAGSLLYRHWA